MKKSVLFYLKGTRLSPAGRILGLLALFFLLASAPQAKAQTWMVSTTGQIKLGILDKYGQLSSYTATFVVHS